MEEKQQQPPQTRTTNKADAVAKAAQVVEILQAAIDRLAEDNVDLGQIPEVPAIEPVVAPMVPSPAVLKIVAECGAARDKLQAETQRSRVALYAVQVAGVIFRLLSPLAGVLKSTALIFALCAVVAFGGCQAEADVDVAAEANVASPRLSLGSEDPTVQPASADVAEAAAGRDLRVVQISPTLSGSAWPIVAVVMILVTGLTGIVALIAWVRTNRRCVERLGRMQDIVQESHENFSGLRNNAMGVAKAITKLPPGPQRNALLTMIRICVPDVVAWDSLLNQYGLRICHSKLLRSGPKKRTPRKTAKARRSARGAEGRRSR